MKKKIISLIAGALMALSASTAFAAFADSELYRVYYDRTGLEIHSDLGKVQDILAAPTSGIFYGTFGSLNIASSFAAYFSVDRTTNQVWVSSSAVTPLSTGNVASLYSAVNTLWINGSYTYSYQNKLSRLQGSMASFIDNYYRLNTEASLANIANADVTQTLYFWNIAGTTFDANKRGVAVATITTLQDGSTTITSTATPIPAAAWLFSSGLMGLAGIRRKMKA